MTLLALISSISSRFSDREQAFCIVERSKIDVANYDIIFADRE